MRPAGERGAEVESGLTSGWHISSGGATYGPCEWTELVAWVREGRIGPDDLVWHAQLPRWMPARQVPGLVPVAEAPAGAGSGSGAPTPAYAQAPRAPSHRGLWALLAGAAVVVVAGAVVGTLLATGVFSKQAPLVETPMRGPTVIDVPYDSSQVVVSPKEGGKFEVQGVEIFVPADAVASETTLELKVLQADFNVSKEAVPKDGTTSAYRLGQAVDFGPEGMVFDKPVTITMPYEESLLPDGVSEDNVALAYWDGLSWVAVKGAVDAGKNTVAVKLTEFTGETFVPVFISQEAIEKNPGLAYGYVAILINLANNDSSTTTTASTAQADAVGHWQQTGTDTSAKQSDETNTYSLGVGSATQTMVSPGTGDRFASTVTWSSPKASYQAGETVELALQVKIDTYVWNGKNDGYLHLGLNSVGDSVTARIDAAGMTYGSVTGGAVRLVDDKGEYYFSVKTDNGTQVISSAGGTVRAQFPAGYSDGELRTIYVENACGAARYTYAWVN
jgi:hypothetical protein